MTHSFRIIGTLTSAAILSGCVPVAQMVSQGEERHRNEAQRLRMGNGQG
ncbi:hypothetical protein PE067_17535 [Paracoccus sp. DMF-8]|nr:hypothetical protein [Paracoccus sp. DMF-8]MDF3607784.1 hypothetical protein [Paracoccus sp. DMF-8]